MNRDKLIEAVRPQMPERRWKHTLGVMETAVKLARQYGADPIAADQAAILHDVAKYWTVDAMEEAIREEGLHTEVLQYGKELWHAHAGAYAAARDYGIDDPAIQDAIRYHTSGRVGMTLLEKVIWLADLIEPGRNFPEVERIRELAERDLNGALVAGFDTTLLFLVEQRKPIFPLTVLARNALLAEYKQQGG